MAADSRRPLLVAALGFLTLDTRRGRLSPSLVALHAWLDSWRGVGHVVVGMERLGYETTTPRGRTRSRRSIDNPEAGH